MRQNDTTKCSMLLPWVLNGNKMNVLYIRYTLTKTVFYYTLTVRCAFCSENVVKTLGNVVSFYWIQAKVTVHIDKLNDSYEFDKL